MAKSQRGQHERQPRKPLVWLHGEVKTPPFTAEGRQEAGMLLRLLQEEETLGMPQAEALPVVGSRCGALRVRDADHNWRIVYRIDSGGNRRGRLCKEDARDSGRGNRALQEAAHGVRCGHEGMQKELNGKLRNE